MIRPMRACLSLLAVGLATLPACAGTGCDPRDGCTNAAGASDAWHRTEPVAAPALGASADSTSRDVTLRDPLALAQGTAGESLSALLDDDD